MGDSLVKNAGDTKQVKEAGKKVRRREVRRNDDMKWILSNVQGRRYLWGFLEKVGLYESQLLDPNAMYWRAGERNSGLRVHADIMAADPKAYLLMIDENERGIYDV